MFHVEHPEGSISEPVRGAGRRGRARAGRAGGSRGAHSGKPASKQRLADSRIAN